MSPKAQAPGPGGPSARRRARVAAMPAAGDRTGRVLGQLTAPLMTQDDPTLALSGCDLAAAAASPPRRPGPGFKFQ